MRGERQLLAFGEWLVSRACRRLPPDAREERYREWAAELPVILHDPQFRAAPRRAVRMLCYAADTFRGTAMTPVRAWRRPSRLTAALSLVLLGALIGVAWNIWTIARAPGHGENYLQLAWALLIVAVPISLLARATVRMILLIIVGGDLAGVAVLIWQGPGDWVNYIVAAWPLLLLLAGLLLARRWARRHKGSPGPTADVAGRPFTTAGDLGPGAARDRSWTRCGPGRWRISYLACRAAVRHRWQPSPARS
jgi:hypothetical protein